MIVCVSCHGLNALGIAAEDQLLAEDRRICGKPVFFWVYVKVYLAVIFGCEPGA
jgi:hypothetical protein